MEVVRSYQQQPWWPHEINDGIATSRNAWIRITIRFLDQ